MLENIIIVTVRISYPNNGNAVHFSPTLNKYKAL